jgi:small subunit ribosomal protein S14
MAKESMKARERKRAKMVEKYAAKRAAESRWRLGRAAEAPRQQQQCAHAQPLPAHGSPPRLHAHLRHLRNMFRLMALEGKIPGVTKSSW